MAKVTSKLQVTLPKTIADRVGIRPGDEVEIVPGDNGLRILLSPAERVYGVEDRLRLFDQGTRRQRDREKSRGQVDSAAADRGWKREDLYDRGRRPD